MLLNLFNIFDPSTNSFFNLNWISLLIPLLMFYSNYWIIPSRMLYLKSKILNILFLEFKILLQKSNWINLIYLLSLFMFIMFMNFMGLFPYIFTPTSHMVISLTLSLPYWLTLMLFKWSNYNKFMFAHLVPLNTPSILQPFMVMIETISNIIRPFTLAIRLSANMIAGHLLLCLIGSSGSLNMLIIIILIMQTSLFILELAVSLIQSYVFTMLSTLYLNE